jgi:hypothetical protein
MSSPAVLRQRDDDEGMLRTYVLVFVCHGLVITALWLFGRTFSS